MTVEIHAPTVTPTTLVPTGLSQVGQRDFYAHVGDINSAFAAAEDIYRVAQANLMVLLTEQVARHVIAMHPTAAMVFVRVAAEFHHGEDGQVAATCSGHNERLAPFEVYDDNGAVLGGFEALSPVVYLMERLSPLLGIENQVLHLDSREWAVDCTQE